MMSEDDKSSIYNIHLCRICQNPKKLDLKEISDTSGSEDGKSCWDTLKYIFCEIIWVEDRLLSLICTMCMKNVHEIARFKKLCLDNNAKRDKFNNVYIELVNEPIDNVVESVKDKEIARIEEVTLPQAPVFIKAEIVDDDDDVLTNTEQLKQQEVAKIVEKEPIAKVDAVKVTQGKRPNEETNNEKVKKLRKDSSASVPNKVSIITSKLSEYLPFQNPRNNETMCKICQGLFSTTNDLRDHIMSHHGMIPRRYRCENCHIGFYTLDEFQCHYKESNHKNFLPLQCLKCGCKTIRRADQNVSAMRCHCPFTQIDETLEKKKSADDRNRKILCMHCNSCFTTLRLAKEHVAREHVAIRPFNCSKCNGSFLSKKLLDEHNIANHHVRCNLCPQSFDNMELWQTHRRQSHDQFPTTNLIPKAINMPQGFHCILCKRVFPTRFRLANHIESQECQQYGTCILCGTTFHGSNITRHLEMNHNIEPHDNNFTKYFKCKTSTPSATKPPTNGARRQCEQYRECNLCAKYLHVSQIRTHLIYTHHVNVYEKGFKLRPFFKNKVQPEVNGVQNVRLYTRNRRHEEHTYSRKLAE